MLNQTIIVGRLTKDPEILTDKSGKKRTQIVVAVNRSFKNTDGQYDTDFIRCVLWNAIAESTCEYCKKGDIIGVKGRLQSSKYEKEGKTNYSVDIIAEKITFLSSKNNASVEVEE